MLVDVTTSAFILTAVPRGMLGRVSSSLSTVTQGVKPLDAITGGALGSAIGLTVPASPPDRSEATRMRLTAA